MNSSNSKMYNPVLDSITFKHFTVLKKSGKVRHVYECKPEDNLSGYGEYINYKNTINRLINSKVPDHILQRTAYNKKVSIPHIIQHLAGSKVIVQLDIEDFFNVCPINERLQAFVPRNYYYNTVSKVGIKQGTNISGDITNLAMLGVDLALFDLTDGKYARYADDIILGCENLDEASILLNKVVTIIEGMGMKINARKTVITDLTEPSDRYVKYLGYTIKRDKYDTSKLRITIARVKRKKWWAKNQLKHATSVLGGDESCFTI